MWNAGQHTKNENYVEKWVTVLVGIATFFNSLHSYSRKIYRLGHL